jgi:hypothetical protein
MTVGDILDIERPTPGRARYERQTPVAAWPQGDVCHAPTTVRRAVILPPRTSGYQYIRYPVQISIARNNIATSLN